MPLSRREFMSTVAAGSLAAIADHAAFAKENAKLPEEHRLRPRLWGGGPIHLKASYDAVTGAPEDKSCYQIPLAEFHLTFGDKTYISLTPTRVLEFGGHNMAGLMALTGQISISQYTRAFDGSSFGFPATKLPQWPDSSLHGYTWRSAEWCYHKLPIAHNAIEVLTHYIVDSDLMSYGKLPYFHHEAFQADPVGRIITARVVALKDHRFGRNNHYDRPLV